jgi:hypothetical protein
MNRRLIQESTSIAQWYALVNEAQDHIGHHLNIDLESYLVFALQRFTNRPDLTQSILALEYLESLESTGRTRADKLRDLGDKCLLCTGFFPDLAGKRHVTVSYFVELGRRAYSYLSLQHQLGALTAELYDLLRMNFINLVDLLLSIRELSGEKEALTFIQAEDLWRNTGSQYAYKVLKKYNKKIITPSQQPLNSLH